MMKDKDEKEKEEAEEKEEKQKEKEKLLLLLHKTFKKNCQKQRKKPMTLTKVICQKVKFVIKWQQILLNKI